jgi:hypothetical protein
MARCGAKKKQIDYKVLEALCRLNCTDAELAVGLGISIDTITRRKQTSRKFRAIYDQGREMGRISLRRLQWGSATRGNIAMQIWLGKQLLGQSDRSEFTGAGGAPLVPIEIVVMSDKSRSLTQQLISGQGVVGIAASNN